MTTPTRLLLAAAAAVGLAACVPPPEEPPATGRTTTTTTTTTIRPPEVTRTVVAYDNLGAGNVWFPGGQRSTTMPGQGNADHDIAQGFDIAGGDDMRLTSFEVVLYSSFGSRRVEASIVADRDQTTPFHGTLGTEPDMSKVLETWMIAGIPTDGVGTLLQILSADRPVLASGERYWLVLSVPDADSNVAWKSARLDYSGYAMIGERDSGLATFDWTTFLFSDSGGTALRVTGTSDV